MTPPGLASRFQSLPPILHMLNQSSVPGYSKGSRGLSVQLQVPCIFTGTTISLSLLLRQWGSRYTIRAGRNLPDKEFRSVCYYEPRSATQGNPACFASVRGPIISVDLLASPQGTDSIFTCYQKVASRVWRIVSEDPEGSCLRFPADCLHLSHCHPTSLPLKADAW